MSHSVVCEFDIAAKVVKATAQSADVRLYSKQQKSCQNCQQAGGCQSLSVYHWFFDQKTVTITQPDGTNHYQTGDALRLHFPNHLLRNALCLLIGLPLTGFLTGALASHGIGEIRGFALGLLLATGAFFVAKKMLKKWLAKQLTFSRDDNCGDRSTN